MKRYHYVYRITNIIKNKHYYGKRSSLIEPKLDLGKIYFSSSTDKDFIKDQKNNPDHYKYKVVMEFETPKDACEFEIKIHAIFSVSTNESFYNKCKATSSSFDLTGTKRSIESNRKTSESLKGKFHSEESKLKMSKSRTGKKLRPMHLSTKVKISESLKNHTLDESTKESISIKLKEYYKDNPHPAISSKKYMFTHDSGVEIKCTLHEFKQKFNEMVSMSTIKRLISGKLKKSCGWVVTFTD